MENNRVTQASPTNIKVKTRSIFTGLILSLAVLVVLNLVSAFFFYRLDVSKGKIHTLSKTSKNLVSNLKDNVVVKVYFSDNLPPDFNTVARYAKDLLGEYKQYGGNRFRYEFVKQTNEDEFRAETSRSNIYAQRVMLLENDQQTVRDIFLGMSFEYKGNRESLNLSRDIEGQLEYEITSLLRRLTKVSLPIVTVYQDSLYNADLYQYFEHHTQQNYRIVPTNLTAPVKASDVLIFTGVYDSLSALQLYNLDQYIMHNGKVLFLQDRVSGLIQYNRADEVHSNIFRLLEHYGIEIKPNLVMDQNCAPINMSQRSGIFVVDVPVPFPPVPMLQGIKSNAITKDLTDVLLYLGSEINTKIANKDIKITPLLKTSPSSGVLEGPEFDISPNRFIEQKIMSKLTMPPITVAALYNGKFKSFFADKENISKTEGFVAETDSTEIIVVSDADIIRDMVAGVSSSNMMFILNAVDFLLKDISLSEIRSRTIPNSPMEVGRWLYKNGIAPEQIQKYEPKIKQVVKGLNLILPSLLLIIYGLRRMVALKRKRKLIRERYQLAKPAPVPNALEQEGDM